MNATIPNGVAHTPKKNTCKQITYCATNATKYPMGFFQSKGNLLKLQYISGHHRHLNINNPKIPKWKCQFKRFGPQIRNEVGEIACNKFGKNYKREKTFDYQKLDAIIDFLDIFLDSMVNSCWTLAFKSYTKEIQLYACWTFRDLQLTLSNDFFQSIQQMEKGTCFPYHNWKQLQSLLTWYKKNLHTP